MEAALFLFYRNNYRESCPAGERTQAHNTSSKGMLCHEKPGPEMHVFPPLLHLVTYAYFTVTPAIKTYTSLEKKER